VLTTVMVQIFENSDHRNRRPAPMTPPSNSAANSGKWQLGIDLIQIPDAAK